MLSAKDHSRNPTRIYQQYSEYIQLQPYSRGHRKPRGRIPGAQTKKTKQWIALRESIVEMGAERFKNYLKECNDEDFVVAYLKILQYFQPKLARKEVEYDTERTIYIIHD